MLTRWNPGREFSLMRRMMDRAFGDDWQQMMDEMGSDGNILALDVDEDNDVYTVKTSIPGVKAENIDVKINGDYLSINVEIPETTKEQKDGQRALMRERHYGRFSRSVRLPQMVNTKAAEAKFEDGVLILTLPKSEEERAKSIPINA